MIHAVTVTNHRGEQKRLELAFPENSGFAIDHIDGLGAGKATINVQEIASADGAVYNSARLGVRNIVIELILSPSDDIEEARHEAYRYFPLKRQVTLRFETDHRLCEIVGYVESNEPDIFSPDEKVQISIICPNPYFRSVSTTEDMIVVPWANTRMFEFPFSNESLTETMIEFGTLKNYDTIDIVYTGDADTGMIIRMFADGPVGEVVIATMDHGVIVRLNSSLGIIAGDEIVISTYAGAKKAYRIRNGETTNIMAYLGRDVIWKQLTPGVNRYQIIASPGIENLRAQIEYQNLYSGV